MDFVMVLIPNQRKGKGISRGGRSLIVRRNRDNSY
jgi:hypothetical protein